MLTGNLGYPDFCTWGRTKPEGDYSERRSAIGWPSEFNLYMERSYAALKAKRTCLLHGFIWRLWRWLSGKNASN